MADLPALERPSSLLVIAAHPDDPEFGCAGTVAKWASLGTDVHYCLVTSGDVGTRDPEITPGEVAGLREREQRAAAAELGVKDVVFLRHHDGMLVNDLSLRRELTLVIRQHRPQMVFTIDPWRHYQLHPDHRAAGQGALDGVIAARERLLFSEQLFDGVEQWRVKEVLLFWTDEADCWVDISDSIDRRIAALRKHASQVPDAAKLEERIRGRARETGEPKGMAYAESFKRLIMQ